MALRSGAVDSEDACDQAPSMPSHLPLPSRFLTRLKALEPPTGLEVDPAVFRRTVAELSEELGRSWHDTLTRSETDTGLRSDLSGILERIALVHARHVDASLDPGSQRARAAVYAAAAILLDGAA